jgi:hypothetical protein
MQYRQIYIETFSGKELDGLIELFQSPAGQMWVSKQPETNRRAVELTLETQKAAEPEVQRITAEWLQKLRQKYAPH